MLEATLVKKRRNEEKCRSFAIYAI